jgi:hypothetical protein
MKFFFDKFNFTSGGALGSLTLGLVIKEMWAKGWPAFACVEGTRLGLHPVVHLFTGLWMSARTILGHSDNMPIPSALLAKPGTNLRALFLDLELACTCSLPHPEVVPRIESHGAREVGRVFCSLLCVVRGLNPALQHRQFREGGQPLEYQPGVFSK